MTKAFLSHAWIDKEFVRAVANDLGRQFCVFDEQSFDTGETFKSSIEQHLDESSMFVLFASRCSLKSVWVDFEIEEAWYRKLEKKISSSIVFMLDSSLTPQDVPRWLSRVKFVYANVPAMAAREIRYHLDGLIRNERPVYFEGRALDLDRFQSMMMPPGKPAPRAGAIFGLPNIGRRTFLETVAPPTLGLSRILPIFVSKGDGLAELAIKIAARLEPYSTKQGFDHIVTNIRSTPPSELAERILARLNVANANKELPVFVDDGGVFDSDGYFKDAIRCIISSVEEAAGPYVFIVSNRKPNSDIPSLGLRPLSLEHIKRLIRRIAASLNVPMTEGQISELSEYVNGYPPSAHHAVELSRLYGVDAVLADKHRLVHFRTTVFIKYLTEHVISENQKTILKTLARYSPLPARVIAETARFEVDAVASDLMQMIDHALVVPNETGLYAIAEPLADAVDRAFRSQKDIDHGAVYSSLKSLLSSDDAELPRLELNRLLFKAAMRSGAEDSEVFHLANDLVRLAEDYYHRRDYDNSVKFSELALNEKPSDEAVRDLFIRGLIQNEQWEIAVDQIEIHKKNAPMRDVKFLSGFLYRKRGELTNAIGSFLEAERLGRTGITIKRELATCYYLSNQLNEARRYTSEALAIREDRFLVDLSVQIATREGNETEARAGLVKLESLDVAAYAKHRRSTVELYFGHVDDALVAAREALASVIEGKPPFGILAQLITCLTRMKEFDEAAQLLARLAKDHNNKRSDVRLGLECRLEIERGRHSRALELLKNIKTREMPVYKSMEREAIKGELSASALTDETRIKYSLRLNQLNAELALVDVGGSWLELVR